MERTRYPGIYKRGGRYVVVWTHRGKQHKKFFRTLAEAREAKGQRQAGDSQPVTRRAFEDYAREWVESHDVSETTRAEYRRAITEAVEFFPGYRLAEVGRAEVRRFRRHLESPERGLSAASVVKYMTPLKTMFATAYDDELIRSDPTATRRRARRRQTPGDDPRPKALTRAELAVLLGELPEAWRLFFELLAHSGLRISEQLGLEWSDLDLGPEPRLRVRRQYYRGELRPFLKTDNGRRDLPLSPGMTARLLARRRDFGGEGPVFATSTGSRYSDRNVRRVLDAAAERAGVPWVSFHTFRHTCASLLFEAGRNVKQVSTWLGHADPAFTLRTYVHLMDEGVGGADFLDAAVAVAELELVPEVAAG